MNMLATVREWNRARTTRRDLNRLDDRMLHDAGIPRWRIDAIAKGAPIESRLVD